MCLGFLMIREAEIDAAAEKAAKEVDAAAGGGNGHEGFSCENTTISLIKSKDGSMKQVCRVPITSSGGGFAAVTMPKQFVANIVSTETPPECLAKELYALMNPEEFVPPIYTTKDEPIYRSLSCTGSSDDKEMEVEPEIVVEFKCVTNAEGSKILIPALCAVLGDNDPQELIKENKFEAYRVAMWKAFQEACAKSDIYLPAFFDCEHDANGDWAVTPIAMLQFVDSLFANLVKDSEVLFLMPPVVDGRADTSAAFPITLNYDSMPSSIWMPSLHHNDVAVDESTRIQDENYYVVSNFGVSLSLVDALDSDAPSVPARLCHPSAFLPVDESPASAVEPSASYRALSSSVHADEDFDEEEDAAVIDYSAWRLACSRFQEKLKKKTFQSIGVLDDEEENAPAELLLSNLLGLHVPKVCLHAKLDYDSLSTHAEAARIKSAMKRKRAGVGTEEEANQPKAARV